MGLAKEFGDEDALKLIPDTKPSDLVYEEELGEGDEPEEVKQKMRDRKMELAAQFEQEADQKFAEGTSSEEEEEQPWSTYTNTDNHPGVIRTQRRVRPSDRMKIELHK